MRYILIVLLASLGLGSCCVYEANNIQKQNRVIVGPQAEHQNLKQ